jgi:hypothetical protein
MNTDYRVTNDYGDIGMTCLQGYITSDYNTLCEVFGDPIIGSGDGKITASWIIKFSDGQVATIYDYKMNETPKGSYDWHIGGNIREVVKRVEKIMEDYAVREA